VIESVDNARPHFRVEPPDAVERRERSELAPQFRSLAASASACCELHSSRRFFPALWLRKKRIEASLLESRCAICGADVASR
jgi:hypothetical protein